eukprot:m.30348 g.30348  ORF g.30348 m.30348 type:complete len:183 (+) comp10599_c0_seq1:171-719(+)
MADDRVFLQLRLWRETRRIWEEAEANALQHASAYCTAVAALRTAWQTSTFSDTGEECTQQEEEKSFQKAVAEREHLSTHLDKLGSLVQRMRAIHGNLQRELSKTSLAHLPPCDLLGHSQALLDTYTKELEVKRALVNHLGETTERQHQLVYLSIWLEQPFLATDGKSHADALIYWLDTVAPT